MSITISVDKYRELVWNHKTPENLEQNRIAREKRLEGTARNPNNVIELDETMSLEYILKQVDDGFGTDYAYTIDEDTLAQINRIRDQMLAGTDEGLAEAKQNGGFMSDREIANLNSIVVDGSLWEPIKLVGVENGELVSKNYFDFSFNAADNTVSISVRSNIIPIGQTAEDYFRKYEEIYNYIEELAAQIENDRVKGVVNPYHEDIIGIFKSALDEAFASNPCLAISNQAERAGYNKEKSENISKECSQLFTELIEKRSEKGKDSIKDIAQKAIRELAAKYGISFSMEYSYSKYA